jgi:hypothetical protein
VEGIMSTQKEHVLPAGSAPASGSRAMRAILAGGLLGGAFDITYACVVWAFRGITPIRVGQSVAAGLLGRDAAVAGGVPTGLLGFALHFGMALVMAAAYYAAATRIPLLVRRAVICGAAYGLGLYLVMNYVVLPLSAIGKHGGNGPLYQVVPEILVHMFLVGVTIAVFARKALRVA